MRNRVIYSLFYAFIFNFKKIEKISSNHFFPILRPNCGEVDLSKSQPLCLKNILLHKSIHQYQNTYQFAWKAFYCTKITALTDQHSSWKTFYCTNIHQNNTLNSLFTSILTRFGLYLIHSPLEAISRFSGWNGVEVVLSSYLVSTRFRKKHFGNILPSSLRDIRPSRSGPVGQ